MMGMEGLRVDAMELQYTNEKESCYKVLATIDGRFQREMVMIETQTMKLVYEEPDRFYCNVTFYVNGIGGDCFDFGDKSDGGRSSDVFGTPCCKDMHFVPEEPSEEILKQYGITESDFNRVTDMLVEQLAFGRCSACW